MVKLISRSVGITGLLLLVVSLSNAASAGRYMVAKVQSDRGRSGCVKSKSGFQIRFCTTPTTYNKARSASRYTIHLGLFSAPINKRNAAQFWAFYE